MISAVSFRSTTPMSFEERITKPQTFAVKEDVSAASSIQGGKKKSSFGKKLLKFLGITAIVAAALALIAKSGKLQVTEGATDAWNLIKSGINKAGNWVLRKVGTILPKTAEEVTKDAVQKPFQQATSAVEDAILHTQA